MSEPTSAHAPTGSAGRSVRHRRVFYIPGYDPVHARRYREIYRREGAAQADMSGYTLSIKAAPDAESFGWDVSAEIEGRPVTARIEVLGWSDIVKRSMDGGILTTYLHLVRTAWVYIGTGTAFRLFSLRKGPVVAGLYPVAFLLGQLLLALALAGIVGWALSALLHPWAAALGLVVVPPVLIWFKRRDNRFLAYYLMQDYSFSGRYRGAHPPELEARMATFGARIAAALTEGDTDEVLVVGHSSGAHVAVSVLADLVRAGHLPPGGPALSLLTLGQVVPMVSFLPDASRLRADLADLSRTNGLSWIDVSAPGDGAAFALCDPVSVSGMAGPGKRWPLVLSCAFTQTLKAETWEKLKRQFFRLHFQYLCAFDALSGRPDDYDYFRITAGPLTLHARLGHRRPSPSRIERAVARFDTPSDTNASSLPQAPAT
ncbi:MAG: hypothetical protein AAFU80_02300 [Pseudomonadota bacterium]